MNSIAQLRKENGTPKLQWTKNYQRTLSGVSAGIVSFLNYRDDIEQLDAFELTAADHNAFNEVKFNFIYDYKFGKVKAEYADSFGRKVIVKQLN